MVSYTKPSSTFENGKIDEAIFTLIAEDIGKQGYSIRAGALPIEMANSLFHHQQSMEAKKFTRAGVGRGNEFLKHQSIRMDEICWIDGVENAEKDWVNWTDGLQRFLNERLFLGLFSFESHFAHYGIGDYYKRHYDAFRGEANRVLSVVAYFNEDWASSDGGELILYKNDRDKDGVKVLPHLGTLVTFLSEEFPHEVLHSNKDRYSIAGWFRLNAPLKIII
jgi:SM-20-related protein